MHVYSFAPHPEGDRALRLQHRLATKAALSKRFAGGEAVPTSRKRARNAVRESAADAASRLHTRLQQWSSADAEAERSSTVGVAALRSDRKTAWIALVEQQGQSRLLCSYALGTSERRRVVSTRLRAVLHVATLADGASTADVSSSAELEPAVRRALRDIRRWCARSAARDDVGPTGRSLAPLAQRTARLLGQFVQRCGPLERASLRAVIADAERIVGRARGSGAEEAMARWCAQAEATPRWAPKAWLTAWQQEPMLANVARDRSPAPERAQRAKVHVRALLLIGPDYAPDYTSACHDTRSCSTSTAP